MKPSSSGYAHEFAENFVKLMDNAKELTRRADALHNEIIATENDIDRVHKTFRDGNGKAGDRGSARKRIKRQGS